MSPSPSPTGPSVLLAGCGKLGGALLDGWLQAGLAPSVVLDRHRAPLPAPHRIARTPEDIPADFRPDLVVLAVKPAAAASVAEALAPWIRSSVVLSVMAGRTTAGLAEICGHDRIIRAMPNTPAAIGKGISGMFAGPEVPLAARDACKWLLHAVGAVAVVDRESDMDAVTAVSGSGPAYVFLLAELLEKAAIAQGLAPDLARKLARHTVSGAGALLEADTTDAADLRRAVTSPNGTTARALDILMRDDAWPRTLSDAVAAATARARELAT